MDWNWVGLFSLVGVVMGLLTALMGLPPAVEPLVWIGWYVLWGVAVVRLRLPPFFTPLVGSVLSGLWTGLIQFALWDRYTVSNPWYAADIAAAGPANPGAVVGFALAMGAFWGLLVGGVCWGIQRARGVSPAQRP